MRWVEGGVAVVLATLVLGQAALPLLDPLEGRPTLAALLLAAGALAAAIGAWRGLPALTIGVPVVLSLAALSLAPPASRAAFASWTPWLSWSLTLAALLAHGLVIGPRRATEGVVWEEAAGDTVHVPVRRALWWVAAGCLLLPSAVFFVLEPTSYVGQTQTPLLRHGVLVVVWSLVLYLAFVGPASASGFRAMSWTKVGLGAGVMALVVAYWAC